MLDTAAQTTLRQIYIFHATAQQLRQRFEYRVYHYVYLPFVSLIAAFSGAGGVVAVDHFFPGLGVEKIVGGGIVGALVGWGVTFLESSPSIARIKLIDALTQVAQTTVNAEIPKILQSSDNEAIADNLKSYYDAVFNAFNQAANDDKLDAVTLSQNIVVVRNAEGRLNLLRQAYPIMFGRSYETAPKFIRRPKQNATAEVTPAP